jgi:hypothetical protein
MDNSTKNAIKPVASLNFYDAVISRLLRLNGRGLRLIKFHYLYWHLSHLDKEEIRLLLRDLELAGRIKVSPFNGIKIVRNDKNG